MIGETDLFNYVNSKDLKIFPNSLTSYLQSQ